MREAIPTNRESAAKSSLSGRVRTNSSPYIGKAELVRNKRATGRAQDLADVEALE